MIFLRYLLPVSLSILLIFSSCSKDKKAFDIPNEFNVVKHDSTRNEVLKLRFNDHLIITVTTSSSEQLKNLGNFNPQQFEQNFSARFAQAMKFYGGYNPLPLQSTSINGHAYLEQEFWADENGIKLYYIYGIMYIHETNEYLDIIISGRKHYKNEHQQLIKNFLNGIYK